jgi:hypothetical protein
MQPDLDAEGFGAPVQAQTLTLEHFHFENALTADSASVGRAREEQAKIIFAVNSEWSVSK